MNKDTGGPAFSSGTDFYGGPNGKEVGNRGMTLRDYFAAKALMGVLASRNPNSPRFHPDDDAAYVYAVADAMLKARQA